MATEPEAVEMAAVSPVATEEPATTTTALTSSQTPKRSNYHHRNNNNINNNNDRYERQTTGATDNETIAWNDTDVASTSQSELHQPQIAQTAQKVSPPRVPLLPRQRVVRSSSLTPSRRSHDTNESATATTTTTATASTSPSTPAGAAATANSLLLPPLLMSTTPHANSMHEHRDSADTMRRLTHHGGSTSNARTIGTTGIHTPPQSISSTLLQPLTGINTATNATATNKRLYPTGENKWVTRDIASLDFLLGIPLAAERDIVVNGWQLQRQRQEDDNSSSSSQSHSHQKHRTTTTAPTRTNHQNHHHNHNHTTSNNATRYDVPSTAKGTWWEKWVQAETPISLWPLAKVKINESDQAELEQPTKADANVAVLEAMRDVIRDTLPRHAAAATTLSSSTCLPLLGRTTGRNPHTAAFLSYAPGRRLEGDEAMRIHIPLTFDNTITKQRSIARQAALREWELQTAHGLTNTARHTPSSTTSTTNSTNPVAVARPASARPKVDTTVAAAPPMLDGRLFFSANSSYPISVFSVIRYEPKKEEAAIRRRKLEAIGGGGSQFVLPNRDWRGISYRALLRRSGDDSKVDKKFNRFLQKWNSNHQSDGETNNSSSSSSLSSSDDDSDDYVPGVLDDPEMVLGRHRTVMIGDRVTGPIVSTTIQFVQPALLKAELNKQFRERFDGWEPPKRARKYIGAKVIQGNYVLMDPTDEFDEQSYERRQRNRPSSSSSIGNTTTSEENNPLQEKIIRMPPSLTLSKIRSLKNQVLHAAVRANLEIGTVALACVYFERLCLDCRVDKSNRRLAFAACLLLAAKLNEPNLGLVMRHPEGAESMASDKPRRLQALIRPNKTSTKMFASLLLFFTQDWSLSLTHLFTAEWGVFAALGFSLDATPVQIAFHFKRLMKIFEWSPLDYLGSTMYNHWQNALVDEEERRVKRERRRESKRQANEERLLNLHIEIENEVMRRQTERHASDDDVTTGSTGEVDERPEHPFSSAPMRTTTKTVAAAAAAAAAAASSTRVPAKSPNKRHGAGDRRMALFNRFAHRRSVSTDHLEEKSRRNDVVAFSNDPCVEIPPPPPPPPPPPRQSGIAGRLLVHSPSMPSISNVFSLDSGMVAIDILDVRNGGSDTSSIGDVGLDDDGIFV